MSCDYCCIALQVGPGFVNTQSTDPFWPTKKNKNQTNRLRGLTALCACLTETLLAPFMWKNLCQILWELLRAFSEGPCHCVFNGSFPEYGKQGPYYFFFFTRKTLSSSNLIESSCVLFPLFLSWRTWSQICIVPRMLAAPSPHRSFVFLLAIVLDSHSPPSTVSDAD